MALNPLIAVAGAAASWFLLRPKAAPARQAAPRSGEEELVGDAAKAAQIQANVTLIQTAINAGGIVQMAPIVGLQQPGQMAPPVGSIVGAINSVVGVQNTNFSQRIALYPSWPTEWTQPRSSYYWKVRNSIDLLMADALYRANEMHPEITSSSKYAYPTYSADGAAVNPLDGLRGFGAFGLSAQRSSLLQFTVDGMDKADLLKIVLAGIYSGIEELWAYNSAYRRFLEFRQFDQAGLDAQTMNGDVFWQYVNELLASRIIAGEEWNAGIDLKYGDSGVNLKEAGYGWLENWASSTLGTGAQTLIHAAHAAGASIAITQAAVQGYGPFWPGDAAFTNAINANTVQWVPVGTRLIQDPNTNARIDVVASREQNRVIVYVPS